MLRRTIRDHVALPGLKDDPQRSQHHRLQHVAFELPTIDDLLATRTRLKSLGIEPVLTADHGASTAFYYDDPDRNSVELTVDNFGDWDKSSEYVRTSSEFAANPMGAYVDPDKMIAAPVRPGFRSMSCTGAPTPVRSRRRSRWTRGF